MATYPTFTNGISLDSSKEPENIQFDDDISQQGTQHSRQLASVEYYRFRLFHFLTKAEHDQLQTFYDNGPRTAHTLEYFQVSPQELYTVKFIARPEIKKNHRPDLLEVEVNLRGFAV